MTTMPVRDTLTRTSDSIISAMKLSICSLTPGGTAVLIENNAQFKNAFGASENVIATCYYDMNNDQAKIVIFPK